MLAPECSWLSFTITIKKQHPLKQKAASAASTANFEHEIACWGVTSAWLAGGWIQIASLSLNVHLGWKARQVWKASNISQSIVKILPGTKVGPVTVVDLEGKPQTISFEASSKPTVLYVISPSCIWCERNKENVEQLTKLKGNEFRFIGLSLADAGLQEYVDGHYLSFPVYSRLTSETIRSFGLGGTPQTIVISREGEILRNWSGAYTERLQPELEAYFQIKLPGLPSASR